MLFTAVPIGLNGLVKPTSLGLTSGVETAALKSAFASQTALTFGLQSKSDGLRIAGGASNQMRALKPIIDRFDRGLRSFINAGATLQHAEVQVRTRQLRAGNLQVETAGHLHIDDSAMIYQDNLQQDRITVRGLWVSERSPVICDISEVADPLPTMLMGRVPPAQQAYYQEAGLMRTADENELILMDMVTPHYARPVVKDTERVLIDIRARLQLPADWRIRVQYKCRY